MSRYLVRLELHGKIGCFLLTYEQYCKAKKHPDIIILSYIDMSAGYASR